MNINMKKRLITSVLMFFLLILMFFYTFILIISLIIISIICWIEFNALISKIFKKENYKNIIFSFFCKLISLIYLSFLVYIVLICKFKNTESEIFIIYSILISIMSDIGGLTIGRIFKGPKLSKISPKKTISGSVGSFIFSILLIPIFITFMQNLSLVELISVTLTISFVTQSGDLFVSYLKRLANVKDTSDLLPGHGGVLDRIDGIIFSIPFGFFTLGFF